MSLDKQTVKHIAHLARLEITEDQLESVSKDLTKIIDWVEQLGEVNTDNVSPLTSTVGENFLARVDEVKDGHIQKDVLKNAPESQYGFYIVPKVVE